MDMMDSRQRRRRQPPEAPRPQAELAQQDMEIDLLELFYHLLDHIKYIIAAAILGGLLAGVYSYMFLSPVYEATAKLYVANSSSTGLNLSDLQIGTYLTNDYQEVFKTWEVHEAVIKNLNLPYTYSQVSRMLKIKNPSNTRVLDLTVTSKNPKEAATIANEYANVVKKYIFLTMATEEPNILSVALEPTRPVGPNRSANTMMGILAGAFCVIAYLTVRFVMDDKIKTADDITKYTSLPTLAVVPVVNEAFDGRKKKNTGVRKR